MKSFKKIICLFVACILAMSALSSCKSKRYADMTEIELYFAGTSMDSLVTQKAHIDTEYTKNTTELVAKVMELMLKGPSGEGARAAIPEGVKLRGVSWEKEAEGIINIDLSSEYYTGQDAEAPASAELLARYSIVATLCQFDEIKKVQIYIGGKEMKAASGKGEAIGALGLNSVMISSPSSVETQTEKFVTLYFADKSGSMLYPETRKATMTDNSLEKTIVSELIRGPVSNEYTRTFSEGVKLISAETTEGVCFVNLSSEFIHGIEQKHYSEALSVYSIVNSLTRLPEISKVQILIDGKKPENSEYKLFNTPLESDDSIIIN